MFTNSEPCLSSSLAESITARLMVFILFFCFFQAENALAAVPEESRSEGKINFKVYRKYFTAGANYFVIFILILFNILAQVSC